MNLPSVIDEYDKQNMVERLNYDRMSMATDGWLLYHTRGTSEALTEITLCGVAIETVQPSYPYSWLVV